MNRNDCSEYKDISFFKGLVVGVLFSIGIWVLIFLVTTKILSFFH